MSDGAHAFGPRRSNNSSAQNVGDAAQRQRLLQPTYQNRLRVIGRRMDVGGYRWLNVMEVAGGLLVRAMNRDQRGFELMEFPDDGFQAMMIEALQTRGDGEHGFVRSPLAPTGYEDMLRAIGFELDQRIAKMIAIVECRTQMFVTGMAPQSNSANTVYTHFDFVLTPDQVQTVLDTAFKRRRAHGAPTAGAAR